MLGGLVVIHSMHIPHPHIIVNQCVARPGPSTILFHRHIMAVHIITPLMGGIMAANIITADTLVIAGGNVSARQVWGW